MLAGPVSGLALAPRPPGVEVGDATELADPVAGVAVADRALVVVVGDAGSVTDGSARCATPTAWPTVVPDDVEPETG